MLQVQLGGVAKPFLGVSSMRWGLTHWLQDGKDRVGLKSPK